MDRVHLVNGEWDDHCDVGIRVGGGGDSLCKSIAFNGRVMCRMYRVNVIVYRV